MFELEEVTSITNRARLKVIGVGGAGGNAVNNMIAAGLEGVEFVVMNTDSQDLISSLAPIRVQLGQTLTRGLGAGADPEKGRGAALEVRDEIAGVLDGADMVFITAGMGGGTGTGAAPVIAEVAREKNILTVAVVTKPFTFEGLKRSRNAESGLKELKQHVDAIITIPNNRLLTVAKDRPFLEAFRIADDVLRQGVQGISDIIQVSGLINADFADVHAIMSGMGRAVMGTGRATGERRVESAAKQAISSPLLDDVTIDGAKGVLVNITGGPSMTLTDANEGLSLIQELADEEANIIFGAVINPDLDDEVQVTVIEVCRMDPAYACIGSARGGTCSQQGIQRAVPGFQSGAPDQRRPPGRADLFEAGRGQGKKPSFRTSRLIGFGKAAGERAAATVGVQAGRLLIASEMRLLASGESRRTTWAASSGLLSQRAFRAM